MFGRPPLLGFDAVGRLEDLLRRPTEGLSLTFTKYSPLAPGLLAPDMFSLQILKNMCVLGTSNI